MDAEEDQIPEFDESLDCSLDGPGIQPAFMGQTIHACEAFIVVTASSSFLATPSRTCWIPTSSSAGRDAGAPSTRSPRPAGALQEVNLLQGIRRFTSCKV